MADGRPFRLPALLSAPLRALLQAQAQSELETLDYIVEIGLGGAERRSVQTLEFELVQPVPDPKQPGTVVPTPTTVSVPILSILQTPSVRVTEANVGFSVRITDVVSRREAEDREDRVDIVGVYASPLDGRRLPTLSVSMKVEASEPSEGYERVKRLLDDTTAAIATVPDDG
jgi:hypothetical protein